MNPNALFASAVTIAFITAAAPSADAKVRGKDPEGHHRAGALRTDASKPQVKCYRETFKGKDGCKGKDAEGYITDRTTNEHGARGPFFLTDAVTCHAAGLSTTPRS